MIKDPKEIEAIEAELARDMARFAEIEGVEVRLVGEPVHDGFRDATKLTVLRSEKEMLHIRIFQNRQRLADMKK